MFITEQHNGEIEKFVQEYNPIWIDVEYTSNVKLGDIHDVVNWCRENFKGNGGGKILGKIKDGSDNVVIRWYITDQTDYLAFKLKWT